MWKICADSPLPHPHQTLDKVGNVSFKRAWAILSILWPSCRKNPWHHFKTQKRSITLERAILIPFLVYIKFVCFTCLFSLSFRGGRRLDIHPDSYQEDWSRCLYEGKKWVLRIPLPIPIQQNSSWQPLGRVANLHFYFHKCCSSSASYRELTGRMVLKGAALVAQQ